MVYMVFSSVYVRDGITKSSVYKNFFWCYICFAKKSRNVHKRKKEGEEGKCWDRLLLHCIGLLE